MSDRGVGPLILPSGVEVARLGDVSGNTGGNLLGIKARSDARVREFLTKSFRTDTGFTLASTSNREPTSQVVQLRGLRHSTGDEGGPADARHRKAGTPYGLGDTANPRGGIAYGRADKLLPTYPLLPEVPARKAASAS